MTASQIDTKLRNKFQSHKYELSNSYVYGWESDFFSISTTGYAQEIEIKVSLSDFRSDFCKISKHNLLRSAYQGKDTYCFFGQIEYDVKGTYRSRGEEIPFQRNFSRSNRSDEALWKKRGYKFKQINSEIRIKKLDKCPNKFWYCCPEGVISVKEIPEYAGLYYINENMRMRVIKKAPFIHKEKQDLTQCLLDKFYWNSIKLQREINLKELTQF